MSTAVTCSHSVTQPVFRAHPFQDVHSVVTALQTSSHRNRPGASPCPFLPDVAATPFQVTGALKVCRVIG